MTTPAGPQRPNRPGRPGGRRPRPADGQRPRAGANGNQPPAVHTFTLSRVSGNGIQPNWSRVTVANGVIREPRAATLPLTEPVVGELDTSGGLHLLWVSPDWLVSRRRLNPASTSMSARDLNDLTLGVLRRGLHATRSSKPFTPDSKTMHVEAIDRDREATVLQSATLSVVDGTGTEYAAMIVDSPTLDEKWDVPDGGLLRFTWAVPDGLTPKPLVLTLSVGIVEQRSLRDALATPMRALMNFTKPFDTVPGSMSRLRARKREVPHRLLAIPGVTSAGVRAPVTIPTGTEFRCEPIFDRVRQAAADVITGEEVPNRNAADAREIAAAAFNTARVAELGSYLRTWSPADLEAALPRSKADAIFASAVAERLLVSDRETADPHLFADALTVLLMAANEDASRRDASNTNARPNRFGAAQAKVGALLHAWVYPGSETIRFGWDQFRFVTVKDKEQAGRVYARLEELLVFAPWLRWFVEPTWPVSICLTQKQFMGVLSIMCPDERVTYDPASKHHRFRPTHRAWKHAVGCFTVLDDSGDRIDMEPLSLLQEPFLAWRSQGFAVAHGVAENLASPYREAAIDLLPTLNIGTLADLRVDVDRTGKETRLLLTNRDPTASLAVTVAGQSAFLSPWADLETQPDAIKFNALFILPGDHESAVLTDGAGNSVTISLPGREDRPTPPNTKGVDIDPRLFVGRDSEIEQIEANAIFASPSARMPIIIQGNRRAGKTTLAEQAVVHAAQAGEVSMYVIVDVTHIAANTDDWRDRLIRDIVEGTVAEIEAAHRKQRIEIPLPDGLEDSRDLVEVFDRLSNWAEENDLPPVGIVLDEYDAWIQDKRLPREAQRMVSRLGYSRWNSLILIATVQRHVTVGEVKEWHMIGVPALVPYVEMARYFAPHLLDNSTPKTEPVVYAADRFLVAADTLHNMLYAVLGSRPYFWDSFLRRLKTPRTGNPFILDAPEIQASIDLVRSKDEYLGNLKPGRTSDQPLVTDDFTDEERTILTLFLHREAVTLQYASTISVEGVQELVKREIVQVIDGALVCNGTIWTDYIETYLEDFQPFVPQKNAVKE